MPPTDDRSRFGSSGQRHGLARPLPVVLAAVLLLLLVTTGSPAGATPGFRPLASETALCATLVSNATLNNTYDGIYDGLPALLKNWSTASNASRPVNQSGYPNLTVGREEMLTAWTSICTSAAFTTLYGQLGGTSFGSGGALNASGDYVVNYVFQWIVSCAGFTNATGVECEKSVTWYHDLVTGATSGPATKEFAVVPTGGPPRAGGSATPPGSTTFLGLPDTEAYALLVVAALVVAVSVFVVLRRRRPGAR